MKNQASVVTHSEGVRPRFDVNIGTKRAATCIHTTKIYSENVIQTDLYPFQDEPERQTLMDTACKMNTKYGREMLKLPEDGAPKAWEMKSNNKSPAFTTCWGEIAICR